MTKTALLTLIRTERARLEALLAGLGEAQPAAPSACGAWSVLGFYAFILLNPTERDWLRRRAPRAVEAIVGPFLRREPFMFVVRWVMA